MKWSTQSILASLALWSCGSSAVSAFQTSSSLSFGNRPTILRSTAEAEEATKADAGDKDKKDPLLIRAAKFEKVERTPIWMMRQAGRHMKIYRDLCKKHTTFRQRSEIAEVAIEISLQPYEAYQTDGCILFSDILTPLPGMNMNFEIDEKLGPVMESPITCMDDLDKIKDIDPYESTPFVAEALQALRKAVSPDTAVLGFVGCPYTLATYLVEGKTSRNYVNVKRMMWENPELLHAILQRLADNIGQYALYQIENGAQLIQIFDSWAGELAPLDYDIFAAPYQKQVLDTIKAKYPDIPTTIYIKHSGALLERMAKTGVDCVSLDWTVDMAEGSARVQQARADAGIEGLAAIQGNLDPFLLYASHDTIKERTIDILKKAGNTGHIMNLGHGIEATTPEENAAFFIETVRNYRHEEDQP